MHSKFSRKKHLNQKVDKNMETAEHPLKISAQAIATATMMAAWSLPAPGTEGDGAGLAARSLALYGSRELAAGNPAGWNLGAWYRPRSGFGLYWARLPEMEPRLRPGSGAGLGTLLAGSEYGPSYPETVGLLGAGFQSPRRHASLGSEIQVRDDGLPGSLRPATPPADADADPLTRLLNLSKTVRLQMSAVYALPSTVLWESAALRLEAGQQRFAGLRSGGAVDPAAKRDARSARFLFAPTWSEVLPNLDVSLPVSLSYGTKSQAPLPGFNGSYKGGKFILGASAVYQKSWNADVRYLRFFGESSTPVKDRDFLWFSVQRSF
ncbi:MAG: hypothetical protein H6R10_2273 [Rhodocyclaceae bacterium]|nr:hypothetical protein [Rhodocyclaceae bacterium]